MDESYNVGVCHTCHRLFDLETGKIVPGWEKAYFITSGYGFCGVCMPIKEERKEEAVA